MKRPKFIPAWVSIPLIIFLVFIAILLFSGDNNYLINYKYEKEINELKAEIKANQDSAALFNARALELNTDPETLEKIAREKYGMKRDNEEVYITPIP